MKRVDVAIAIVLRGTRILITRRRDDGPFAGYWEFPGGKCEPHETIEQCLARELWEELAIRARPVMSFAPIHHSYPHTDVCLHPFLCLHEAGEPQLVECQDARWIDPPQLRHYQFPEANARLIDQILEALPPSRNGGSSVASSSAGRVSSQTV
jgi:mutator protein MutT